MSKFKQLFMSLCGKQLEQQLTKTMANRKTFNKMVHYQIDKVQNLAKQAVNKSNGTKASNYYLLKSTHKFIVGNGSQEPGTIKKFFKILKEEAKNEIKSYKPENWTKY